jgi:nicotinamidase-related amidase
MSDDPSDPEAIRAAKLQRIDDSHRCAPGKCALLVIDMQHGFLDEDASLGLVKWRELIPNIQKLISASRANNIPVIFTEFVYSSSVPCLRGDPFGMKHLPAVDGEPTGFGFPSNNCLIGLGAPDGAESAATVDELKPEPGELVVQGHTYDKFYGTHLDLALRSHGVDRLILTGITTDVCVNTTLMSGSTRNYRVTAVTDAMGAVHDHHHDACLQIWENKFARLKTTDEVYAEIG